MAVKTARLRSEDMTDMVIDDTEFALLVRSARITKSPAVIDSTAIEDEYRFNQPGIKDSDFIITKLIESTGAFHTLVDARAQVNFSTDIAGETFTGWGHLFDYEAGVEVDGVQVEALRLSVNADTAS